MHYVHLKCITSDTANKLFLIHGFGGGAGLFMAMAPHLQKYFEVYLIDLPGFAGSSRGFFPFANGVGNYDPEEVVQWFVKPIKMLIEQEISGSE